MKQRISFFILVLLIAGCGQKKDPRGVSVFSILPAENLTGKDSLNWVGAALPALLTLQLEGTAGISVRRVANARESIPDAQQIHCRYQEAEAKLSIYCWEQGKDQTIRVSGDLSAGLSGIASQIARQLSSGAREAIQISNDALRAYTEERYEDAIRLAPTFPLSYVEGALLSAAAGNRDLALNLVNAGIGKGEELPEFYLAQLELTKASLTGDRPNQIQFLGRLVELDPNDPVRLQTYAQVLLAERRIPEAAKIQGDLARLVPENIDAWNSLGYYRAYAGDFEGAKQALEKYATLSSQNPNALDSLGEIHFYTEKFIEAEKYFLQSFEKDPKFNNGEAMFKAAISRFRAGDRSAAGEHYQHFVIESGLDQEWAAIRWEYLTGDEAKAIRDASQYATQGNRTNIVAAAHAALWTLNSGDTESFRAARQQLVTLAQRSRPQGDAALVGLIVQLVEGKNIPEPPPQLRPAFDLGRAVSMLYREQAAAAESLLKPLYERTSIQNDRIQRILLAWAAQQNGNQKLKEELLKINTVPPSAIDNALESVLFRRELELRH